FMGFYLRVLRPGRVLETTAIGVALLLAAIVYLLVRRRRRGSDFAGDLAKAPAGGMQTSGERSGAPVESTEAPVDVGPR
ncbi:MAG TPA: hypothetical protein VE571_09375, partial [Solirubrobacteraceae bacterium]|nr:hypothetical protein [Solirubrobacteraceae bacterium]